MNLPHRSLALYKNSHYLKANAHVWTCIMGVGIMQFDNVPDGIKVTPNSKKMRWQTDNTMTRKRPAVLELQFRTLCKLLMEGCDSFDGTHSSVPAIRVTVDKPLEAAMRILWMVQAYTTDDVNLAAFSEWCETASKYQVRAMKYFQSLPLYRHDEFTLTEDGYKLLGDHAESALKSEDVCGEHDLESLAIDITRRLCNSIHT